MRADSRFASPSFLAVLSGRISGQLQKMGILVGLCGVLAASVLGTCGTASAQTKTATATTLAVTSGGNAVTTVASGSVVTLTAQVNAGATALTAGQVKFCDASVTYCTDIHVLGTAQLTSAGTATVKFRPGIGSHNYKAVFAGTNTYAGSSSASTAIEATGTIPPLATATTINQTGSWGAYTLSATVTETGNIVPPTGAVSFLDTNNGNAVLGTGNLGSATRGVAWTNVNTSAPSVAGVTYAVADLNRDGIPDLFVKDYFGTYDVLLGNGDGTFTVKGSPFGPSSETGSFIIGDFNNDGIPDVAAIDGNYYAPNTTITIFLGNGDGTFTASGSSPALGFNPTSIATADINGDGDADLIIVEQGSSTSSNGQVVIFFGNGDGTFTQASTATSVVSTASSIIPADLNRDGKIDLVLTGVGSTGITILLGNGDGTFTTIAGPGQLGESMAAVADVNNDGIPDLVFPAASTSYLTVFLGNGDGTFTEAPSSPNGNVQIANFAITDFNQDGIPDIVYANLYTTTAAVLFGNGDGTFVQTPESLTLASGVFGNNFVVADFNGDGFPDVLSGGNRAVADSLTQPTETATASAAVAIAAAGAHLADASYPGESNYNASTSGTVSLWGVPPTTTTTLIVNVGGAPATSVAPGTVVTLAATVQVGASPVTVGWVSFCDASATDCADIHLLGTAALSASGMATYKFVPGPGVHSYKVMFVQNGFGLTSASAVSTLTVGPVPSPVYSDTSAISVNGSPGDYSLTATVVGYGGSAAPTGSVSFLDTSFANASLGTVNLGPGTAGTGWLISQTPAINDAPITEVAGDFNGDGIPDLAFLWAANTYGGPPSVTILLGNGDGTFTTGPTTQVTGAQGYPTMTSGDFNDDGKTDLVVLSWNGYSSSYATTLLGNGDGTFGTPITNTVFTQSVGGDGVPGSVVAADFNGDGKLDLAVVGDYISTGGVTILLGNGDGTFTAAGPNILPTTDFGLIATGDFNGDGIPDLIVTHYYEFGSNPIVLLGKGDGTFTALPTSFPLDYFPKSIVVGDFNGDDILDLGFSDLNGVEIALGKGDGTFKETAASPISVPGEFVGLSLGDFNHDGKLDIAGIYNYNGYGEVALLIGAGDGTFTITPPTTLSTIQNSGLPSAIVVADFNGNGVPDLALLTQGVNTASILLTEPTETATATVNGIAPIGSGTHNVEAIYPGDSNYPSSVSGTAQLTAGLEPLVISPAEGIYSTVQTITITEPVAGATIYYQAYGTVNTSGFVVYTGPIQLTEGGYESISAYAIENGYQQSNYATAIYTLELPAAPAPVFSPAAGTYSGTQTVSITDAAPGATIYYTTNGTVPGGTLYTGPITVSSSETLTATAIASGYSNSGPFTAQYLITSASTPLIYTIAGNGSAGYSGDGGPATAATLNYPAAAIRDALGNLYIADSNNNLIRKVAAGTGIITTIAGNGTAGFSGDNGPATSAELNYPFGLALDSSGDIFIADEANSVVREINATTGVITTIAGNGTAGFAGDTNTATGAELNYPHGLGFDSGGNLYIADTDNKRIRKVAAGTGIITTVAGGSYMSYSGDGGPATSAGLSGPYGVSVDSAGNLYISDTFNNVIRKVNVAGIISTIAGHASSPYNNYPGGYSGDGGPATSAQLYQPDAVAIDSAGNLYIADTENSAIREVTASTQIITTVAGNGLGCYAMSGDGGAAASAGLCYPQSVFLDNSGNLIVADSGWNRIREITAPGVPPSAAAAQPTFNVQPGTYVGTQTVNITDATPGAAIYVTLGGATPTTLSPIYNGPISVTGSVTINALALAPGYLASAPVTAAYTITTPPTSIISTVAGNGLIGFTGQGGPATSAEIGINQGQEFYSQGIALDSSGNLYFADSGNNVVWMVAANTGIISIVAGNGSASYPTTFQGTVGDGGPATSAEINAPSGLAMDSAGNLYISDPIINVVRKVTAATGIITTVAGNGQRNSPGSPSLWGNGGPAISASLYEPTGLAVDAAGDLYIADYGHGEVREVSAASGIITAVAGNGGFGATTSGGAATSTPLYPAAIALDSAGNLYIAEISYGWVGKVSASTGILTFVAGNGVSNQNSGDGGLATTAAIIPSGIGIDAAGDLYIPSWPDEIRKVSAGTGIITKVAGNGYAGFSGDGGSATVAGLNGPTGIVLDAAGNIYFGDVANDRIRKVTFPGPAPAPSFSLAAGTYVRARTVTITDSIQGAAIYYTTDGSTATTASNLYSGPITVSATETLQAIAVVTGYTESAVTSAAYTINQPVTPTITWATPAAIMYGTALSATQLDSTSSVAGTFAYTPASGTVLSAGSQTLSVLFTPTDAVDYTTAAATVTLSVNKATAAITWATPAAITYGTALSATQLDATSKVAGTFVYTPTAGTVLTAGPQTLSVTFTPTDTTDYATASATVTLTLNKATPAITWGAPAAVTYGTALGAAQLDATSSVGGTFAYNPAAGTVLTAGSQKLSVTFTPTDTTNYTTDAGTVTLVVNKAAPTITWTTPAAITYGTALGAAQLNATSSVAGTLAYTPAAGMVLPSGSQKLSVAFTPTDMTDYTAAAGTVTLVVNKAAPTITWGAPAAITYGTALGAAQLDATSKVAGTFVYTPAAGTVLTAGSQTLSVTFTPTDTTDYTTGAATVTLVVNKAAPVVTETPSATSITTAQSMAVTIKVTAGSSSQTPSGSVTLSGGGYTSAVTTVSSGSATINIPAGSLAVGSDTLMVSYTPDASSAADYTTATQSAAVTVTQAIGTASDTVTVTPTATTITNDQSMTVQIAVAGASGQATPTGTVTLTSGSYMSQQVLSGGTASFNIAAGVLSSGADTLNATYSGDATYAVAIGTATVTVSPVAITIPDVTPISPGNNTTAIATFTAGANYSGTMNLTCTLTNSPTGALSLPTCSLNPASIMLSSGGTGNTSLTIGTTLASATPLARLHRQNLWGLGEGSAIFAGMLVFFLPSRRRRWISMLALILIITGAGVIGCGGEVGVQTTGPGTSSTTAGNYTFTLTGADSANNKISASTTVAITVQ